MEALTGDKVAYVAENGEAASLVLAERFPSVPNIGDITTYDFTRLRGEVDKITAGFPCQPVSNAGLRLGVLDERWLWPSVARAVRDIRPRYVFLENVSAIRHRGRGHDAVLGDLATLGYDAWWTCLRASEVGGGTPPGPVVLHRCSCRRPGRRMARTAGRTRGAARGSTTRCRGWWSTACRTPRGCCSRPLRLSSGRTARRSTRTNVEGGARTNP